MLFLNTNKIFIITDKRVAYSSIIHGISISETIYLLENLARDDRRYI